MRRSHLKKDKLIFKGKPTTLKHAGIVIQELVWISGARTSRDFHNQPCAVRHEMAAGQGNRKAVRERTWRSKVSASTSTSYLKRRY